MRPLSLVRLCLLGACVPLALAHHCRPYEIHGRFELLACCCDALLCGWDWVGQRVLIPVPPRLSAWVFVSLAQVPLASLAHVLMPSGVCDLIAHVAVHEFPPAAMPRSMVSCSHTCSSKQDVEEPCIAPALFRGVAPGAGWRSCLFHPPS